MAKSAKAVLVSKTLGFVTERMLRVSRARYEDAIDESFAKLTESEMLQDGSVGADIVVGGQTVHAELI